ncbi:aspartate-semialdehyde dehydrogenase [Tistrella mobilis]|uniref:Aspartate-semialdehyde dehydrogenase, USG-1 n=1 Tax=Tistrella mobilis (strain KA081020-065) TaxID=1110502 RepID=I3TQQ5_TISMK|nr:aspartate-semialdehyde dehydrogenase [Tistrella mobilis]AFK55093.1 Aspartate-semialdehyde dehydrogenase, USG-1 [Tistrella mobilis KA081020-065]
MADVIAVIGAAGAAGREVLQVLAARGIGVERVRALETEVQRGDALTYGDDHEVPLVKLADFDFAGVAIAIFAGLPAIARVHGPRAAAAGAVVVDMTGAYRSIDGVPQALVPVNPRALRAWSRHRAVACPPAAAVAIAMALKPLHALVPVTALSATVLQSVSGAGKAAMDELFDQTKDIFIGNRRDPEQFPKQIAFNVIGAEADDAATGRTREEHEIAGAIGALLGPAIAARIITAQVPVFIGDSIALSVTFERAIDPAAAWAALHDDRDLAVTAPVPGGEADQDAATTPVEIVGEAPVYVSRLLSDRSDARTLDLWIVADNLHRGQALTAVEIAEALLRDHLTPRLGSTPEA